MSYLRSPFHSHVLCLRNFSDHFRTYLRNLNKPLETCLLCDLCRKDFDGSTSVYSCERCRFYLHTSCARPLRQIQHPRHEHPLDLRVPDNKDTPFSYRCVRFGLDCDFELDAGIAMATLWVEKYYSSVLQEAGDGESQPQFAHKHPLSSFPARTRSGYNIFCGGCKMQISEEAYGCSKCNFYLHEACAKAPLEIQHHPIHPDHPLYLFYDSSSEGRCVSSETSNKSEGRCHACDNQTSIGYRCNCEECEGRIFDLSCVIGTMPCEAEEREEIRRLSSVMDHYPHPHHLSSYHAKIQTDITCRTCSDRIQLGDFFGCPDCSFFLHKLCAQPPAEIQHYLHPGHTLTFARFARKQLHICPSCSYAVNNILYFYTCRICHFYIHHDCAVRTLSYLEEGVSTTVQHSLHKHELKLCYIYDYFHGKKCTVCDRTIGTASPAYKCISLKCSFHLHILCAQLPSNLVHPSHSLHPLTLCYKPPYEDIHCCHCDKKISGLLAFSCGQCNFYLDVDCAQIPTLKHPLHEHSLFYFGDAGPADLECSACRKSCKVDLFRCVQCDFNLHYNCSQLPPTTKSEHHWEPLVLRESYVEDDSGEYYCDICEKRRDPNKWVYFCETCNYNFVAHIECALSPVKLEVIEEDNFIRREEEIVSREQDIKSAQEEVEATEAALRPQLEKLELLRAKLESQAAQLEELKTEHAKWIL